MKNKLTFYFVTAGLLFCCFNLYSQNSTIDQYRQFLENNKELTPEGLLNQHPGGFFKEYFRSGENPNYWDEVNALTKLTPDEIELFNKHSFVVTERLDYGSFWQAYTTIYENDLPLFISSDAILHALHMSYDAILKDIEKALIYPRLEQLLLKMHGQIPVLESKYAAVPEMGTMLMDVDVYLTVAIQLLQNSDHMPHYTADKGVVEDLMDKIKTEKPVLMPPGILIFSDEPRSFDFSQFTPRGHYADETELTNYFKCMIWLGRTELYMLSPKSDGTERKPDKRQIIDASLILEAAEASSVIPLINEIDQIIISMVGESDNVKLNHIREILNEAKIASAAELLNDINVKKFIDILLTKPYSEQKILSQILYSNPFDLEQIVPASAFLLFGQRFVIDSYVTGNVVYDKIIHDNQKVLRMLPSSLDVLYTLGNNAAAELLKPELEKYYYSPYLASLRYLIDSYPDDFWKSSVYNCWLQSIRSLNTPDETSRNDYPGFMQTAAWWQQKMNTQLASWAQLRHDNLLYAKQSYSGGASCSFPYVYLEPVPQLYASVAILADRALDELSEKLKSTGGDDSDENRLKEKILNYFKKLGENTRKLTSIAEKELKHEMLTQTEKEYLAGILTEEMAGCAKVPASWYSEMYYLEPENVYKLDYVIADVHTAPTDEYGNDVGWVWHVGTGPLNIAVITTKNDKNDRITFLGPVMSYYEMISLNFKRWTDKEWKLAIESNAIPGSRPKFTDLYMADSEGKNPVKNAVSLPVGVESPNVPDMPEKIVIYPNPANESAFINFSIPDNLGRVEVNVKIYDLNGITIKNLYSGALFPMNYSLKWLKDDDFGRAVQPGVYICELNLNGNTVLTGKITIIN